jgi:putative endonuclease
MAHDRWYHVYIMSDKSRRLYIGVTNDVHRRAYEHKHKLVEGFTSRYAFDLLVYYERFSMIGAAITREKQLKGWLRSRKRELILRENPQWADLSAGWYPHDEVPWPMAP